jgi:hypothetical protein
MKRSLVSFALVVAATAFSLLMAEVVLRALGQTKIEGSLYVADEATIYRPKPFASGKFIWPGEFYSTVNTNSRGFRGTDEYAIPKPPGVKRVFAIGDSFTFGYGVNDDEAFPKQLEKRLARSCQRARAEVVNAGVFKFSTSQELAMLEKYGLAFEPDVVMLGFYTNDPEDNVIQSVHYLEGDTLRVKPDSVRPQLSVAGKWVNRIPGYDWLVGHSALVNWTRQMYFRLGAEGGIQDPVAFAAPTNLNLDQDTAYAWRLTERLVDRMKTISEANSSEFIVVLIPDSLELKRYIAGQRDSALVMSGMRRICRTLNLNCIDVADWIVGKGVRSPSELYFPRDGHFTVAGNTLTAEAADRPVAALLGCGMFDRNKLGVSIGSRRPTSPED